VLRCNECKAVADDAAEGWQAHLAYDPREDEESFVVFFCPDCASREFGLDSGL
jgi:Zn finger protein HypA/HybF involved in hydrogenase expression